MNIKKIVQVKRKRKKKKKEMKYDFFKYEAKNNKHRAK